MADDLMPSPGMILCGDPAAAFAEWLGHIEAGRIGGCGVIRFGKSAACVAASDNDGALGAWSMILDEVA
jgi:hypothetical protein